MVDWLEVRITPYISDGNISLDDHAAAFIGALIVNCRKTKKMAGYFEDQRFENVKYDHTLFPQGDYEGCTFQQCDFNGADLSNFRFTDCDFNHCNLSNIKTGKTSFNDIRFSHCKLLGINFEQCSEFLFSVSFDHCTLDFSSFYKRGLKKAPFKNCSMKNVDFTDCDCRQAIFERCNLEDAKFENTNLEKADLRGSFNLIIDPELNRVKHVKISLGSLPGLLHKYDLVIE